MAKVTLHKRVKIGNREAHCYREVDMPAVSAEMEISEDQGNDPVDVMQIVFGSRSGILYVSLGSCGVYEKGDIDEADLEDQWLFETDGWVVEPIAPGMFSEWPRWYEDQRRKAERD